MDVFLTFHLDKRMDHFQCDIQTMKEGLQAVKSSNISLRNNSSVLISEPFSSYLPVELTFTAHSSINNGKPSWSGGTKAGSSFTKHNTSYSYHFWSHPSTEHNIHPISQIPSFFYFLELTHLKESKLVTAEHKGLVHFNVISRIFV